MYLDRKAILKSLTKEDIIKIVMSLGSKEPKQGNNGELIFQTICHNLPNNNNSWKLYYYHDSQGEYKGRRFHCYTKCGDSFDIVELVIRANRTQGKTITWYKALYYIALSTGKVYKGVNESEDESTRLINDFDWINRLNIKKNKKAIPELREINENVLDIFYYGAEPLQDWLNEGISLQALNRYEIGYYGLTNQITIPHRDINERLIGVRVRNLDPIMLKKGKYMPIKIGNKFLAHSLGSSLYGLWVTKDKIKQCRKIMLVESEKSCLLAYTYFSEDSFVAAVCGSNITTTHIKIMLQQLQVEEVQIAFDREYVKSDSYEATAYYNKLVKKAAPLVPYCRVYLVLDNQNRIDYKDSPFDKGKDILLELMKEKVLITVDEVNRVFMEEKVRLSFESIGTDIYISSTYK